MSDSVEFKRLHDSATSGSHPDAEFQIEPFLYQTIRVLRRRAKWGVLFCLLFIVPASVYIERRPPVYRAAARLLIERDEQIAAVLKEQGADPSAFDGYFQTQLQLLRSRVTVLAVVQRMKLWEVPQFATGARTPGLAPESAASGLVDAFLNRLTVVPAAGTHLVTVSFDAVDPTVAKDAVNILNEVYIADQTRWQSNDSSSATSWVNDRLAEQRQRLEASEAALQNYIAEHNAVSVQDRQNIVVQKLSDLNTALTRAKTERMAKETLFEQLRSAQGDPAAVDTIPLVLSSAVLQQLRAQVATLRERELAMSHDLGDRHPDLVKLRSEIELVSTRLRGELGKLTESVRNDFLAAQSVEANLTTALERQKRDVIDLNQKSLEYGALERQATSDRQIYDRLLTEAQMRGVTGAVSGTRIRVVEPAELPLAPTGPPNNRDLLLVMAAGLMLGLAAPLLIESLNRRIKTPADVEARLRLACIAMVPRLPVSGNGLLMTSEPTAFNEAFRRIRATVDRYSGRSEGSRLLITSTIAGEGKTMIAANVAIALARTKQRVLLVDGDLRRPRIHTVFGLAPAPGLTDLLAGNPVVLEEAIRATDVPDLFVLPCGTPHADAAELLASPKYGQLLSTITPRFHWIIFDSPPVGPVADACIIGRSADAALIVVAADTTTAAAAFAVIDQLKASGVKVAGAVLNLVDLDRSAYYYGPYHSSSYSAYYSSDAVAQSQ